MSPSDDMTINEPVELTYDDVSEYKPPTLADRVLIECKRLATASKELQEKIQAAKTKPKKDYFGKKLKKNNNILGDMLVRLEQLHQIDNNKKEK